LDYLDENRQLFDNITMYENIDSYYENQIEEDILEYLEYIKEPV
jgi:hypothetical protein